MKILSRSEFIKRKQHDTLAIMGCSYAINDIRSVQWWDIVGGMDTLGLNWFCNGNVNTTFYLIREQCTSPKKLEPGSMIEDLLEKVNGLNTTLIVKRKTGKADNYFHPDHLDDFTNDGIIVNEITGKCSAKAFRHNIFEEGMHHGKNTMFDALHFAVFMGYKMLIFCGVSLNDYRYFWLPYDKTREIVANEGKTCNDRHPQADKTLAIIQDVQETYPHIEMFVQDPKSLLTEIMPVWRMPV